MTATRNSVYLEQKAQNLRQALSFFSGSGHRPGRDERLLAFLDQIDFWDWEVEELCFSFQNFRERAAAFDTCSPGERAASHGILVKDRKAQDVKYERRYASRTEMFFGAGSTGRVPVVVPMDALQATLTTWHEVLAAAEKSVMATPSAVLHMERAGVTAYKKDLSRFRKGPAGGSNPASQA